MKVRSRTACIRLGLFSYHDYGAVGPVQRGRFMRRHAVILEAAPNNGGAGERRGGAGPLRQRARASRPRRRRVAPNRLKGASPAPWRLPAIYPLFGERKQGNRRGPRLKE